MANRISVKSVKTFAGHDGIGWQCKVMLDGNQVGDLCVEDGWGGGLDLRGEVDIDQLQAAAIEQNPYLAKYDKHVYAWEVLITNLVMDHLEEKDIQRKTTKEVWFQLEGDPANQYRVRARQFKVSSPQCHMDEHRIIDAIVKHAQREGQAITAIRGIRQATKRKELLACQ